jgi:hypothetical protein
MRSKKKNNLGVENVVNYVYGLIVLVTSLQIMSKLVPCDYRLLSFFVIIYLYILSFNLLLTTATV